MRHLLSCEFNFDTVCVELKFSDGSLIPGRKLFTEYTELFKGKGSDRNRIRAFSWKKDILFLALQNFVKGHLLESLSIGNNHRAVDNQI